MATEKYDMEPGERQQEHEEGPDDVKTSNMTANLQQQLASGTNVPAAHSSETAEDVAMNRRVNRKMDFAMLPMLSLLYLFNGLDRSNVGNAETQGFAVNIGATPDDYNLAISLFYITFVLFQPPSAAVGRWMGAKNWVPIIMFCWGVITIAQSFIHGRGALIAMRLLIGVFEAGFYPCAVAYLSFFYRRFDLAVRVGVFYGQYAIAGAFSGAISYGIFHLTDKPLYNWQYLFIIEGSLTSFIAILAWLFLPSGPGSAWFLSQEERDFASERIRMDNELFTQHSYAKDGLEQDRLSKRDIIEAAKDWKLWYVLLFNICASVPTQAFSIFLPLVLTGMGFSSINANLMTVPPYIFGAIGLYIFAYSSDYFKERGYHIIASIGIGLVGLIVTVTCETQGGKYAGLCVLLFGTYVSAPLTVAWLSGNTPEPGKRAIILGVNGFGNLAGVIGGQIYASKYGPDYHIPFYITLGFVAVSFLGYIAYRFTLQFVNNKKRKILASMTPEEIERERTDDTRYADRKLTFMYGL